MRSNIDATITNTTRLGVDISGRVENTLNVGASQGIFQQLVRNTPVLLCRYPDGTFAVPDATHPNIVASNQPGGSYSKGNTFVVDARVELDQKLDFITSGPVSYTHLTTTFTPGKGSLSDPPITVPVTCMF